MSGTLAMSGAQPAPQRFRMGGSPSLVLSVGVAVALILVGLVMALYNERQAQEQKIRTATVEANILAGSLAAPLAFDDRDTAREYVDAQKANPEVEAAGVYQLNGSLAAGFARAGGPLPTRNAVSAPVVAGNELIVTVPVAQAGLALGSIYLRTVNEPLTRRVARYGGIALLVLMAAVFVAAQGASYASLLQAQRKLRVEVDERLKAEEAMREAQRIEADTMIELEAERGRAALRKSEDELDFALRAGNLGSWTRDLATGAFSATEAFREHFGLGGAPLSGLGRFLARIHPEDRERLVQAVDEAIAERTVLNAECRTVAPGGDVRWILILGRADYAATGEPLRMAGVSLDVTERKRADITRDQLIAELTASNEERAHFAHVASHDLREPLRMVESFCGLLADNYADKLDARGRQFIDLAVSGAVRMRELVDDLVDYGRLGVEAERSVWFDSAECLKRVLENLHEAIQETDAEITSGSLPKLYGNPIRFIRLMQNLIGNALKYVPAGVAPRVAVAAVEDAGFWRFSISDNGIGIESRHFERIFEPFRRLHGKDQYAGTGLGLAICRKIVQGFGGEISLRSEPGHGSTFSFTAKIHREGDDHDGPHS